VAKPRYIACTVNRQFLKEHLLDFEVIAAVNLGALSKYGFHTSWIAAILVGLSVFVLVPLLLRVWFHVRMLFFKKLRDNTRVAPNTHNYYSLIARAVADLGNSDRKAREALYERARLAQRNSIDPALSKSKTGREREALEQAIRMVEADEAEKAKRLQDRLRLRVMCRVGEPSTASKSDVASFEMQEGAN